MVKYLIYPFILVLGIGTHLFILNSQLIPLDYIPMATFFVILPSIIFLESVSPHNREWLENKRDFKKDIFLTLGLLPMITFGIKEVLLFLNTHFKLYSIGDHWSFIGQFMFAFFFSEFLFYWYHRFSHHNKFLRKLHSVHHGAEKVYWANSGTFHYLDMFFQFLLYFMPIFLFRVSMEVATLILSLSAITGVLEHSNINYRTSIINYFFNTAELHHKHHSKNKLEANSNFGKVTVIFDVLFKTYLR